MKRNTQFFTLAVMVGLSGLGLAVGLNHRTKARPHRTPVLVELFTSEGCSDCPSADKLLARLQSEQPDPEAWIIPLSEHVDYFNSAQWRDVFSSPQFSSRQLGYVGPLHASGEYTPQMVVDGRTEFVGSDEARAAQAISSAARAAKADVTINSQPRGQSALVTVQINNLPNNAASEIDDVIVALTENNLSSQVSGGENRGRRLLHTAVVRDLKRIGSVSGASYSGQITIGLEPNWKPQDLSVVAFVQGRNSRRIYGAGLVRWEK